MEPKTKELLQSIKKQLLLITGVQPAQSLSLIGTIEYQRQIALDLITLINLQDIHL